MGAHLVSRIGLNAGAFFLLWIVGKYLPVSLLTRGMIFFLGAVLLVMLQTLTFFWNRVVSVLLVVLTWQSLNAAKKKKR